MSHDLKLYHVPLLPDDLKVRVSLGVKKLEYERIEVSLADRSKVFDFLGFEFLGLEVSGQPLTPVLVHGESVLHDTGAILRYLDVTFPASQRLFPRECDALRQVEKWELWEQTELVPVVTTVMGQFLGERRDASLLRQANESFNLACAELESELLGRPFLLGETLTAADIVVGCPVSLGLIKEARSAAQEFLRQHLRVDRSFTGVAAWVERLLAFAT
ncbi:MAG: glutathione S-transferase family protein [Planctomycetota bacterium]